ncbi:MAG: putative Fe-S cluster assembly protein SufT [Myxococcota bacterium]
MRSEEITFGRETQVVLIPDGVPQVLPEGTKGWITQVLGGNYTIQLETGRLVRVGSDDADAIGRERASDAAPSDGPVTPERVWDVLKTCYDPEIPLDIVQLGLIYELMLKEHEGGEGVDVEITMTLTAPGCGMGQVLADDVQSKVSGMGGVKDVRVQLTFDPPWSPDRMSEEGRLELGMFY